MPQISELSGHRVEEYWVMLLDLQDRPVRRLEGVTGGRLTQNVHARTRGGGSLEYTGPPVEWLRHRVQPWVRVTTGKTVWETPLGVYSPSAPVTSYDDNTISVSIELYDKTELFLQDKLTETLSVGPGRPVTSIVRDMLSEYGRASIVDKTDQLRTTMVWGIDTPKLQVINDLLGAINYFSLRVDGRGIFRVEPYRAPAQRGITLTLADNEYSVYTPEFTHDYDTYEAPNQVICLSEGDGVEPALRAVAKITDPTSQLSHEYRERWITKTLDGVAATSQTVLQARAERFLTEATQVGSKYAIQTAHIPVHLSDVARFVNSQHGIDVVGVVERVEIPLTPGDLMKIEIREVSTI